MITIDITNDYGVQTGAFDISFTATNSYGNDMSFVAAIKDVTIYEGTAISGEETTFTVSQEVFDSLTTSYTNLILTISETDTISEHITFTKFIAPEIISQNNIGFVTKGENSSLAVYYEINDILSPESQKNGWQDVVGIMSAGAYLDDLDTYLPVLGYANNRYLQVIQVEKDESKSDMKVYLYIPTTNIEVGKHKIYIVLSMVKGGWDYDNPVNPWEYDNYYYVQKEIDFEVINESYSWITPKTNWNGEPFNIEDYNRIKGNLYSIHKKADTIFGGTSAPELGSDKSYTDYYFAREFNAFEDELENLNERTFQFDIGEKQIFYDLGKFIGYEECNRIESAQLQLYNEVDSVAPIPTILSLTYDGTEQNAFIIGLIGACETTGITRAKDVGVYTTIFTLYSGYKWLDGTTEAKSIDWEIKKRIYYIPTVSGTYVYNRQYQDVILNTYLKSAITVLGDTSGKEAGEYTIAYHLSDENGIWIDGTTEDKTDIWTIEANVFEKPTIKSYEYVYDGETGYTITEDDLNNFNISYMTLASDTYYNAGTYTSTVSLDNTASTKWSDGTTDPVALEWTIQKADGRVTLSTDNIYFNFSNSRVEVEATDMTGQISAVSSDEDIVIVKSVSSASTSAILTFDRGTKTGTTTITVNIAESHNYKATSVTISVVYEAVLDGLSVARAGAIGASGAVVMIAGGYNADDQLDIVEAYSSNLEHITFPALSVARSYAASAYDYWETIIAGGTSTVTTTATDRYDMTTGTKSEIENISEARSSIAGIYSGYYYLFAGGSKSGGTGSKRVDIYNNSFTHSYDDSTDLNSVKSGLAAALVGNYVLFAGGGTSSSYTNEVEAYDKQSLTKITCPELYNVKARLSGGSTSSYAIFVGGQLTNAYGGYVGNLDCYDSSLTKHLPSETLENGVILPNIANVGDYMMVAGGAKESGYSKEACAYDNSLTKRSAESLSEVKAYMAAGTTYNNKYALFAGGLNSGQTYFDTVEIYNQNLKHAL